MEVEEERESQEEVGGTLNESDPTAQVTYGSKSIENLDEDIGEDWVSLFLDASILDKESPSFSSDLKPFPSIKDSSEEHFLRQNLSTNSLFINSTDNRGSHSNSNTANSSFVYSSVIAQCEKQSFSNIVTATAVDMNPTLLKDAAPEHNEPLFSHSLSATLMSVVASFGAIPSAVPSAPKGFGSDAEMCPSVEESLPFAHLNGHVDGNDMFAAVTSSSLSPVSSITQVSAESRPGMGADPTWRPNENNPEMLMRLKCESAGDVASGSESPTSPFNPVFSKELGCSQNSLLPDRSILQGEEKGLGEAVLLNEAASSTSSLPRVQPQQSAPESQKFNMQHLHGIGNAIKVGLLSRSGDRKQRPEVGGGSDKCQKRKGVCTESLKLQTSGSFDDQQSYQSDGENKGEGGEQTDVKRQARLMRNCESAKLSRRRKRVYMDELEGRLRTMAATVAELNATISHLTAENMNLRRQLGYYYPPPGICPRPGVPMVGQQVLPMTPYPGMAGGRLIYPASALPSLLIPWLKTQPHSARTSKRSKVLGADETSGDNMRAKRKLAGAASVAVMSLLCVAMICSPFNWAQNMTGSNMHIQSTTQISGIQVGGRVLMSWSDLMNPFHLNQSNLLKQGPEWPLLEEGKYGPEREGVMRVYSTTQSDGKQTENMKLGGKGSRMEAGLRSLQQPVLAMNSSLLMPSERESQAQPDCFGPLKPLVLVGGNDGMFLVNVTKPFRASLFVPRDDRLVKVDGNLIIQAVMAGDKAAMQSSGKIHKAGLKRTRALKAASTKALETKAAQVPTQRVLVTDKAIAANQKSLHSNSSTVPSEVQPGLLQQWVMGGLQVPKEGNPEGLKNEEGKKLQSLGASLNTPYNNCPYAVVPRGPLHSWFFSGLSTEVLGVKGNLGCKREMMMALPSNCEERFGTCLPSWAGLPLNYHVQQLGRKDDELGHCFSQNNTCSKLNLQQNSEDHGLVLSTGMCTELFQLHTSPVASAPTNQTSDAASKVVAESVASEAVQGRTHTNTSSKHSVPLMPQSRRDPFAVPLPPASPSTRVSGGKNGSDPTVEKMVRDQLQQQGEVENTSSMVVSVLAGPQEFAGTGRRKVGKGMSRIFVVVLVDGVKYVTYSCVLPSAGPQPHIVTA